MAHLRAGAGPAGSGEASRDLSFPGQPGARRSRIRGAGAVRADHRCARRSAGQGGDGRMVGTRRAGGRVGRLWAVHDRLRRYGRAVCRPAGAPPAAGRPDRLFRTRAAIAYQLPFGGPFGPADEGDAGGHRCVVDAVARPVSRFIWRRGVARDPVAAVALPQLGPGPGADRGVHHFRDAHGPGDQQDRDPARHRGAPLFQPRRTGVRCTRQRRAGAGLRPCRVRKCPTCAT